MKEIEIDAIEEGCRKCIKNAESLIEESKLLLEHNRWARAFFLSSIAMEELGKYILLKSAQVKIEYGNQDWNDFWKRFKKHKSKKLLVSLLEDVLTGDKILGAKGIQANVNREESIKMWALYTDFYENNFFTPMEVIDEKTAKLIVRLAEIRLLKIKSLQEEIKDLIVEKRDTEEWYNKLGIKELVDKETIKKNKE